MTTTDPTPQQIRDRMVAAARRAGVDGIGFASVADAADERGHLFDWLARGYHASMQWMARDPERRADIEKVLPGAQTVISVVMNYNTGHQPCDDCGALKVSRYAWGTDYHLVMGEKLKALQRALEELAPDAKTLTYVDTGPVMEKVWAQRAGLGWIGKNTNLLTRRFGSWVFLGELITTVKLPTDDIHTDYCGSCTRCLDACPTDAFPEPYVLDSNKCISYWTIEHRGEFPKELGLNFDGWVFGCDVCQDVCPWNTFGQPTGDDAYAPDPNVFCQQTERWKTLTPDEFKATFAKSPIRRTGHDGLMRNIRAQNNDPLTSALGMISWEPIDDNSEIVIDEIDP